MLNGNVAQAARKCPGVDRTLPNTARFRTSLAGQFAQYVAEFARRLAESGNPVNKDARKSIPGESSGPLRNMVGSPQMSLSSFMVASRMCGRLGVNRLWVA